MNIIINKKEMTATVQSNGNVLKTQELDADSFKSIMIELCGDDVEALRKATRLFKPSSYEFEVKG